VACGYSQVGGVDFTEVFSPVVNDTSFQLWLIWSMIYWKKWLVFDIDVAFLNGDRIVRKVLNIRMMSAYF